MKYYYYHDLTARGRVERIYYQTTNQAGEPRTKYANVYLPHGYDDQDAAKRYNILYLMHGGGGNPDAWLDCCMVKNMLDYAFSNQLAQPMIVVFPTFYKDPVFHMGTAGAQKAREDVLVFQEELGRELLPAVEGSYRTFAQDTTPEGLRAAREHRAFGGFSLGGATTWFVMTHWPEYFSRFLTFSGDCWELEPLGGHFKPRETARFLHDFIRDSEFRPEDFHIYAATGTKDAADQNLTPQIEEMKKLTDVFHFSEDWTQGNLHFLLADGEVHSYEAVYQYLYNYLPVVFG